MMCIGECQPVPKLVLLPVTSHITGGGGTGAGLDGEREKGEVLGIDLAGFSLTLPDAGTDAGLSLFSKWMETTSYPIKNCKQMLIPVHVNYRF